MARKKRPVFDVTDERTIRQKEQALKKQTITSGIFFFIVSALIILNINAYTTDYGFTDFTALFTGLAKELDSNILYAFPPTKMGLLYCAGAALMIALISSVNYETQKRRLKNNPHTLHGSSEWQAPEDFTGAYAEHDNGTTAMRSFGNGVLAKNTCVSLNQVTAQRCLNTLVIGEPGSGKSRYVLKPNLLQLNSNYIITDPSGDLLSSCGETLRRFGYNVRVFDINTKDNCCTYNPFKYIRGEDDIRKMVLSFMENTKDPEKSGGDQFWDDNCAKLLSCETDLLLHYGNDPRIMGGKTYVPCFGNLCTLTRLAGEPNPKATNAERQQGGAVATILNEVFKNLEQSLKPGEEKPYCLRTWKELVAHPDKTYGSVLATASSKLEPFNFEAIKNLTSSDTVSLDTFGTGRDVLFIIIPQTDTTYRFLSSYMYTQLFQCLYDLGEKQEGAKTLKLPNGELVKHYPASVVKEGGIDADVALIKKAKYRKVIVNDESFVLKKKKKKKIAQAKRILGLKRRDKLPTFRDEYYEIYDADDRVITRRPTEALAKAYISNLQSAYLSTGVRPALPVHCRFLQDEAANTGKIPNYLEILSTVRKYEISVMPIFQSQTQIKGLYKDAFETVSQDCPFTIYLGGAEETTTKSISEKLGNSTVRGIGMSDDAKKMNTSVNLVQRKLLDPAEVGRLKKELIIISGLQPIQDEKYDLRAHKNYRYTHDFMHDIGFETAYTFDRSKLKVEGVRIEKDAARAVPNLEPFDLNEFQKLFSAEEYQDFMETELGQALKVGTTVFN